MGRLTGKVALVSGGARGQGEAEVRLFVAEGAKVVFGDVLDDLGEQVAKELGDDAVYVHLDVRTPTKLDADQERILREFAKSRGEEVAELSKQSGFFSRVRDATISSACVNECRALAMISPCTFGKGADT